MLLRSYKKRVKSEEAEEGIKVGEKIAFEQRYLWANTAWQVHWTRKRAVQDLRFGYLHALEKISMVSLSNNRVYVPCSPSDEAYNSYDSSEREKRSKDILTLWYYILAAVHVFPKTCTL